jgi:hypothetical protein
MFRQFVLGTALAAFALATSLDAQQQPSPVQPSPVKRTILQRADVPGTNLEIIYATVEIAEGRSSQSSRRGDWARRGG